jgi:hypothetical protein
MQQSEQVNELFTAVAKAQAEIKNPAKNTKNTYFKNEYADLTAVLNAIRPVASAHGLSFVQSVDMVDDRVTVQSQVSHSSGQWIKSSAMVPLSDNVKNVPQEIGIISTYIRRYQAQAMWCINAEQDDDAQPLTEPEKADELDDILGNKSQISGLSDEQYAKQVKQKGKK